ncbi:hypothetical protein [Actinomadura violacea]|uniref:DUF3592 domain-containing protein n=1 Tax=Actinomadura violacea TaxID=2819934 RepID=A0ABS3RUU3_9ACTN|nr:hypothetical protein [Actinomadura violacea]MBO2460537.1 hypothetical protein [Actinomadura violacea]
MRWAGMALGAVLVVLGVTLAMGPYRNLGRLEHARSCAGQERRDCLLASTATVTKRYTYETNDDPPTPPEPPAPPPQPPPPPQPFGVVAASTTTHYAVVVRGADGGKADFDVDKRFYEQVRVGTVVRTQVWNGKIVRVSFGRESEDLTPRESLFWPWSLAWTGLVALVGLPWKVRGEWWGSVFFCWVGGAVLFHVLLAFGEWRWAVWGVPPVLVSALLGRRAAVSRRNRW